jgi:hypothetical protein
MPIHCLSLVHLRTFWSRACGLLLVFILTALTPAATFGAGLSCEDLLNLKSHLIDLQIVDVDTKIEEGLKSADDPELLIQLEKLSRTRDKSELVNWLSSRPRGRNQIGLTRLPYLAKMTPNLDWLPIILSDTSIVSEWEYKSLVEWAPLWMNSPQSDAIQAAMLKGISQSDFLTMGNQGHGYFSRACLVMTWLFEHARGTDGEKAVKKSIVQWLSWHLDSLAALPPIEASKWVPNMISVLPYADFPPKLRKQFEKNWLNFEENKPIVLDFAMKPSIQYCGTGACPVMFQTHLSSMSNGRRVLIWLNGNLIGSLKTEANTSFLSFRNVFDFQGRLILATGGVYQLTNSTFNEILARVGNLDGLLNERVDLQTFSARPLSFLVNNETPTQGRGDMIEYWMSLRHTFAETVAKPN